MNDPASIGDAAASTTSIVRCTGGEAIARTLAAHGCGPIFGMGGFQLLPMYDAIRRLGLRHVLVNDERAAAFAADAYARASGRVGVCDATLGPGATNLITGLVEATNAGTPVIAIVGDANRSYAGKGMTQEAEQVRLLRPAVKELLRVEVGARIPELVRRAHAIATSGRPGAVVLDVPEDVAHGLWEYDGADLASAVEAPTPPRWRARPAAQDLDAAARLLAPGAAIRPVILAGGGVHLSGAYDALAELAATLSLPVAHTISGKGALACTHPLNAGLFGRYSGVANDLIERADCILAVGTRLGEIATRRWSLLPAGVPIVQVEIDANEVGRSIDVDVALIGDARLALEDLTAACGRPGARVAYLEELRARRERWRKETRTLRTSDEHPITMPRLIHELNAAMPREATLVADGGFASHWTALLYETKSAGRGYIANRGFASIGYGLPAALGARLAETGRPIVGITGDGGLCNALGELETAARIGLAFTLIVVNNAASGYVKALQHAMYDGAYQSADLSAVDYARVARALGCEGIAVDQASDLAEALCASIQRGTRPTLIDVRVTRDPARMLPGVDSRTVVHARG